MLPTRFHCREALCSRMLSLDASTNLRAKVYNHGAEDCRDIARFIGMRLACPGVVRGVGGPPVPQRRDSV
jgi:hypothetical protein